MTTSRLPPPAARAAAALAGKNGRANARDDERNRRRAHQQEEPVAKAPAPHRLVRDLLHEHQRRELDHALALALNQVDEHRHGDGAQPDEQKRRKKRHCYLTFMSFARLDR